MKVFEVRIRETIEWVYKLEANTEDEAVELVELGNVEPVEQIISSGKHSASEIKPGQ